MPGWAIFTNYSQSSGLLGHLLADHLDKFLSQTWKKTTYFEDFSFLFKLKSQSASEDKFFSTRGEGGDLAIEWFFSRKDIVGSISCWCEGEDPGLQRDQYWTDRGWLISRSAVRGKYLSPSQRQLNTLGHTVSVRWQVSVSLITRHCGNVTGSERRINVARFFSHCLPGRWPPGRVELNWNTNSFMISSLTPGLWAGLGRDLRWSLKCNLSYLRWLIPLFSPVLN